MSKTVISDPVVIPGSLSADSPVVLHTDTACLAFIDPHFMDQVWEDLLYDGHDHDHGAGGLALNSASLATHLEYDGDFPMVVFREATGLVRALEVNLDPYSESWSSSRLPVYGNEHSPDGHTHDSHDSDGHDSDGHEHPAGHDVTDGWSSVSTVDLITDRMSAGDPAGLPCADDTGGLVELVFPAAGGRLTISVLTKDRTRVLLRMLWAAPLG